MGQTLKPSRAYDFWATRVRKLSWKAIPNASLQEVIHHFRPQGTGQMDHVALTGYREGKKLWKHKAEAARKTKLSTKQVLIIFCCFYFDVFLRQDLTV